MPNSLDQVIRPEILRLLPYHVPSSSGMIKLDAMENPYSLPETLREEIAMLQNYILRGLPSPFFVLPARALP